MFAYGYYLRPGPDPGVGGRDRVEVVDGAAGGVGSGEGVAGGLIGAVCHGLVPLAVQHAAEGAGLEDDLGYRVREGRVLHPVEHDGADRDLAGIGLAPRLGRDEPRQQRELSGLLAA